MTQHARGRLPAKHLDAAAGFIIMEQVESGGNTIAVATARLETGMLPMHGPTTEFSSRPRWPHRHPSGMPGRKVTQITFTNVPAFAAHLDAVIDVPTLGKVTVDVACGGLFSVITDVRQFDGLTHASAVPSGRSA